MISGILTLSTFTDQNRAAIGARPFNNVKIYGGFEGNNDAAGDADQAVQLFWQNVLDGCAACRFHRRVSEGNEGRGIGGSERSPTFDRFG